MRLGSFLKSVGGDCFHILHSHSAKDCHPPHRPSISRAESSSYQPRAYSTSMRRSDDGASSSVHTPAEDNNEQTFEHYRRMLVLTPHHLQQVVTEFREQMEKGLDDDDSDLLMIPTMVDTIPDGMEQGELFGIEIGGSKLHLVHSRLPEKQHGVDTVQVQETLIPSSQRHCSAEELFRYIAKQAMDFATSIGRDLKKHKDPVVIGFCFSFPCKHESIKSGKLLKWTKGFENEGGVGKDPAQMLAHAFKSLGVHARVEALANDTVGVLSATRYTAGPDANVAVVMGTGTNACYVESIKNVSKFQLKYFARSPEMVINIEWPGFKCRAIERLQEDVELDAESHRPGDQTFEKLTSGLYMGEIARRILLSVAETENWPRNEQWMQMKDPSQFTTTELAAVAQDNSGDLKKVASIMGDFLGQDGSELPGEIISKAKQICFLVTKRSAQLIAAAIIGVLKHVDAQKSEADRQGEEPQNIVAVDGGILSKYDLYRDLLCEAVKEIAGEKFAKKFRLNRTEGGAGFGAASLAASSYKYDMTMGRIPDLNAPTRKFPPRRTGSGSPHAHAQQKGLTSDAAAEHERRPAALAD